MSTQEHRRELHLRVATALGLTESQVNNSSYQTLIQLMRPISFKLANELVEEMEEAIQSSAYFFHNAETK